MHNQYQTITTTRKQYGFDFLDAQGATIEEVTSFGREAIVALYDQYDADEALWPEKAQSIGEVWERTITTTAFKRVPQQNLRHNPANGRFMRTSYRENQNL